MKERTDVVIVGGGPIGIETAVLLKRAGLSPLIIEAGEIGATLGWWAPGTKFFSSPERLEIAGAPLIVANQEKATREEYMAYLRGVAQQNELNVRTFTRVVGVDPHEGGFVVRTARSTHGVGDPHDPRESENRRTVPSESTIACDKIILAIGNMHRPRLMGIEGEDLPFVSHYLGDPHRYFGRRVLIVGGKNSAVEAAIRLYRVGAHVTLCYRRAALDPDRVKYWLMPEIEWLIEKGKIGFIGSTEVRSIGADGVVGFADSEEEPRRSRSGLVDESSRFDDVLLLTGYMQDKSLFEEIGVELVCDEQRPCMNRDTMETNVPSVYVAGTACGGTQKRAKVFIETSHVHAERIAAALTGSAGPSAAGDEFEELEES